MAAPRRSSLAESATAGGARFLVVEAGFYADIAALLRDGAEAALEHVGATWDVVGVPGALEIPIAMAIALDRAEAGGRPFDGAIALGCVLRGETFHFEIVASESARALLDLAVARRLPVGNGILTVDTQAQAEMRADPARGDKGGDAARAALSLYALAHAEGTQ
jgi:6,7-dimethyl-8-ribityllumazine synthase